MKKVLLAFSGGLDTSYCAIYLSQELGLEVYAALVDTGGFSEEEVQEIERRAYSLGVKQFTHLDELHQILDLRQCAEEQHLPAFGEC